MKKMKSEIKRLTEEIEDLLKLVRKSEVQSAALLEEIHPNYRESARNLVQYRALRSVDIRDLQKKLGALGLSRIARAECHVLASLKSIRSILESMISSEPVRFERSFLSIKKGRKLIRTHSKALLGYRSKGRRVRIMVTLPSEAATQYPLVRGLVENGMNSARINCAHDGPEAWQKMIDNIRTASERLRRNVKICMDLGGPKIRTGAMRPGPRVTTFAPERDTLGRVIGPALLRLQPEWSQENGEAHTVPLPREFLSALTPGEILHFEDTRGKKRDIKVVEADGPGWLAHCYDRAYIRTGTVVRKTPSTNPADGDPVSAPVGVLPPAEEKILLRVGDRLLLHRDTAEGEPAQYDEDGRLLHLAHISCTSAAIFDEVEVGQRVMFDDGKITGVVKETVPGETLEVEVIYARQGGQKLRADKGINLPDCTLHIRGLTEKDREDLQFIARHADVVSMSFVNTPQDVRDLLEAMEALGARDRLGVILKIETQQGFDNLTDIMLAAMQTYPVGVMIARGDLAVEVGWENMPRIQEEILSLCLAAHMPDIWATQVLENLAKKGLPSRAEVTDAAQAQRAECVMLNKGPYIVEAIRLLDKILVDMKDHQDKNAPLTPAMA